MFSHLLFFAQFPDSSQSGIAFLIECNKCKTVPIFNLVHYVHAREEILNIRHCFSTPVVLKENL